MRWPQWAYKPVSYICGKDASGIVETQLGGKVVKSLIADLKGKGHHLYFDNYYFSSVTLAEDDL